MTPDEKAEVCDALNEKEEMLNAMQRRLEQAQEERKMWRALLDRAAELLRAWHKDNHWHEKRDEWLKDAECGLPETQKSS
jgi:hypothetical protein